MITTTHLKMFLVLIFLTLSWQMHGQENSGKPVFESKIIDTKNRSVEIKASIKGAKKLFLVVDDAGNYSHDWADWINPRLVGAKGEVPLTSIKWKRSIQQWGKTQIGKNAGGQPLKFKGQVMENGIGTHANSIIEYDIPAGEFTEFRAIGVIDDGGIQGTDRSSVQFLVYTMLPEPRQKKIARSSSSTFDPEAYKSVEKLRLDMFHAMDDLEVTVWAESPLLYNPTNMDVDKDGRIWVAEGVRYRGAQGLRPEGDRIVVLEDTNRDGKADKSHVFVQEEFLLAPLGVAVIDNKIIVSQTPSLLVYTDVNRNLKFDEGIDKREELLTGFQGRNHDHSLHSVTAGPDGLWYFNHGNCGSTFTDKSGRTFRIGSPYMNKQVAGHKSDDGHVWLGGATFRMNPDGTHVNVIGHNYRNSYEQCITSFGDVFQNDNDDPPASRTTFVLEYGNAGFASSDGKRSWQADRRPGQPTPIAEWRQDDPGTMPAGDVYGGGAPTGIVFYENGALGEKYEGLLLSCEPARNVVFGYHPELDDAGYKLDRLDFLTTNVEKDFAGADFRGGASWDKKKTLFRPSDVTVGVDGAIYVADWYDPRVGGHGMIDRTCYGTIYRIAPKGFKPRIPKLDLNTTRGQIRALKSPAVNVRNLGFERLKAQGESSIKPVARLLKNKNKYIRGRVIWLLSQLGPKGLKIVEGLLENEDEMIRINAFRALRRENHNFLDMAGRLAKDSSPAVRREVALSMRNIALPESHEILLEIAKRFDGKDRTYLEALGTGCYGKETQMYKIFNKELGGNALFWSNAFERIAWRLMSPAAMNQLSERVQTLSLPESSRLLALDALAFIQDPKAGEAIVTIALNEKDPLSKKANWWIQHRHKNTWRAYNHVEKLNNGNSKDSLNGFVMPEIPESALPDSSKILSLNGNAKRGKTTAMRCIMCHRVGELGVDFGPALDGWGKKFNDEQIVTAIVNPHKEIALGFEGTEIKTRQGHTWQGRVIQEGDPVVITIMGGSQHAIDAGDIASRTKMKKSLMLSAGQLKLTPQDVRDLVEFLKE